MVRLMETPGWPVDCGSSAFQIAPFRVREYLHQWYSISEIMIPSSFKLTIVAVIGAKEYCKLKEKFWNASRPDIRTRQLAAEVGVSQFVLHRTLKEEGLHPFHVQKVQTLELADFPRRVI